MVVIINKAKVEVRMSLEQYDRMQWAAYRRHMSMSAYCCKVIELAANADYAEAQRALQEEADKIAAAKNEASE